MRVEEVFQMLEMQETTRLVNEPAKLQLNPRRELDPEVQARREEADTRRTANLAEQRRQRIRTKRSYL